MTHCLTPLSGVKSSKRGSRNPLLNRGFLLDPLPTEDPEPSTTPVFLEEPQDSYVIRNKPATLSCKARHALQVYFECNGRLAENRQHSVQQYVNPMTGVRQVEVSVDVTRGDVEKILAGDVYSCYCFAWSSTGRIRSRKAIITLACEYNL
ncbi:Netrin receptor UNC5B [Araneus ventricosus]|uniref:Netrin receptor UNC5B n=1 Tax=Araneus ventricosus TaxID=182803 RepID=A0A4Y2L6B3_ARAVE|nr:Netrin receptor UNC5B [Araneus ventricosus]